MQRRCWPGLVAGLLLCSMAVAAPGDLRCNPAGTQREMNVCAADDFRKADAELNATWQALLKKEAADKLFIARLRTAQKAWLAFRDAELAAYFACAEQDVRQCWGSMYPLSFLGRKAAMTQERTRALKAILEEGHGH